MARPKGGHNYNWKKHPEIEARLDEIYKGRYSQETADILNSEFGTSFTPLQISKHLANMGKKSGVGKNRAGHRFFWTPEREAFVAARLDKSYDEVIDDFEKEFGIRLTWGSLGHFKWRHGLYSENTGRFQPGHTPPNVAAVGAEADKGGNYTWVKVSDQHWSGNESKRNWAPKQRVIWEEINGPLPEGMFVTFRDGDRQNFSPDNLMAVNRAELNYMSKMGVKHMEPEVRPTGELVAKLRAGIYTRRNEKKDGSNDERA